VTEDKARSSDSRWSLHVATVRGIPISIHASFLLLMLFLGWSTYVSSGLYAALIQQGLVLAVFVCVALHELGHATVAIRYGVPMSGITLYPFGGVARMASRPPEGVIEVVIAFAGPAVNLAIAGVLFVISAGAVVSPGDIFWMRMLSLLFWANIILAGFNLLPAFPLDGGRILRGLLTTRLGWARATVWAASIGQVAAVMLILVGFLQDFWLVLAGLLVLPAANAELRYALAVKQFANRLVGEVARTKVIPVDGTTTISEAADLSVATPIADFLVMDRHCPAAYLSAPRLWARVRSDEPGTQPVIAVAEPLANPIPSETPVEEAIEYFRDQGPEVAAVVDTHGRPVGVISKGDLIRAAQLARHATSRK
jgi:Zn-dependent protease